MMKTILSYSLKLVVTVLFFYSLLSNAGTISTYPRSTTASPPDLILIDIWDGSKYVTKVITVTNFASSAAIAQSITNLVWAIRATNGYGVNTTISNLAVAGSLYYTNSDNQSNSLRLMITGTNPPAYQMFLLGESIQGGNTNFLDTLNIGFAYDLTNNYGDITWGNFNSGNIGSSYPQYNQEFELGMSSVGGNWNAPYPGQSNYGVYDGAWNSGNSLVLECNGAGSNCNPFIISGHVISGEISPTWFISKGHSNVFVTDHFSGRTNYFDMNRKTGNFSIPYGSVIPKGYYSSTADYSDQSNSFQYYQGIGGDTNGHGSEALFMNFNQNSNCINLSAPNDTVGAYASIRFTWGNGPPMTDCQEIAAIGVSTRESVNFAKYWPGQGSMINGVGTLYFETDGGHPWVFAGTANAGVGPTGEPEFFMETNHYGMHITDWATGQTNYFNFIRTNANFTVPYGSVIAHNVSFDNPTNTPANTNLIRSWFTLTNNGAVFYVPMYQ